MIVKTLTNVKRKDSPLSYRREFDGKLHYVRKDNPTLEKEAKISFIIEKDALGQLIIHLTTHDPLPEPDGPVEEAVKEFIADWDGKNLFD